MSYSQTFKCYKADITMPNNCKFKFIVNDKYCLSKQYFTAHEKSGIDNNVFILSKPEKDEAHIEKNDYPYKLQLFTSLSSDPDKLESIYTTTCSTKKIISYCSDSISTKDTASTSQRNIRFVSAAYNIKRDDKSVSEDSYFLADYAIGLADGVGGWTEYGINSSNFSNQLMAECSKLCTGKPSDPMSTLINAYGKVSSYGSSTAVMAIAEYGMVSAINLGDSGFIHIKFLHSKPFIAQKSTPQQHDFNVPFQLARIPSVASLANNINSNPDDNCECTFCKDNPESADYYQISNAFPGDLIILASDGVLDNLFDDEILSCISRACERSRKPDVKKIAYEITKDAFSKSKQLNNVVCPFNEKLEEYSNIICDAGKEDDICAVVALLE